MGYVGRGNEGWSWVVLGGIGVEVSKREMLTMRHAGLLGGLAVSTFSKTLALLLGSIIFGFQVS